jgi:hypothetical protein
MTISVPAEPHVPAAAPLAPKPGSLIDLMKTSGRKFAWAYAALFLICALNAYGSLKEERFENCFLMLVGAAMAANFGEHKAKQPKMEKPDAPAA